MSIAEGVGARVAYKAYSDGVIVPAVDPDTGTHPGASGGQILRRVSSTLKLGKDTYQSAEVRSDRQIADFRHGTRRGSGSISGELSGKTYQDLMAGAFRADWSGALASDESDFTSAVSDNATSKFTFAGGDPVAEGYRVGDVIRFSGLAATANNAKNFMITGFGGTSNREVSVYPAPTTDNTPDTEFDVARAGRRLEMPSSGFVSRRFGVEHYFSDIDQSKLFTECRVAGMNLALPATGMATAEFPMVPRNMKVFATGSSPYFSSPAAETTTPLYTAVGGLVLVGGTQVGIVSGGSINLTLNPTSAAVWGSDLVPEIHLGRAVVTGQLQFQLQNLDLSETFLDENEVSVLLQMTANSDASSPVMVVHLPRIKFGDDDQPVDGEGAMSQTMPFQALKYVGSAAGVPQTTMAIVDTESAA